MTRRRKYKKDVCADLLSGGKARPDSAPPGHARSMCSRLVTPALDGAMVVWEMSFLR